jgi:hypothetical protein
MGQASDSREFGQEFGAWRPMATAPRDGSRILAAIRASEQGPAEVDVVRFARTEAMGERAWIAADSDPGCVIVYADAELTDWMPLPAPLPKLRANQLAGRRRPGRFDEEEMGGSGI